MDVKEIIMHLENFANTWNGWSKFLGGLEKFFGADGVIKSIQAWAGAGDNLAALKTK